MAESEKIYLRQAQIGPMANFVYLVGDPKTRKLAVVDPAWDVEAIRKFAETEGYAIDKILITHYHPEIEFSRAELGLIDGLLRCFALKPVRCVNCWRRYYCFAAKRVNP